MTPWANSAAQVAREIGTAVGAMDTAQVQALVTALSSARRVVCHGLGREGLMMRAFAMRLYHLGLDASVQGDVTCPPVGPGDLFLTSVGPGHLATAEALIAVALAAGADVACLTAEPTGPAPKAAGLVLVVPAQTMARDQGAAATSTLPMGSLFEGAMFLAFELMVMALRNRLAVSPQTMRARHTNLE